jgi:hypothetical protein
VQAAGLPDHQSVNSSNLAIQTSEGNSMSTLTQPTKPQQQPAKPAQQPAKTAQQPAKPTQPQQPAAKPAQQPQPPVKTS